MEIVNDIRNKSGAFTGAQAGGEVSEEMFLQLLTTQLQYQDPFQPTSDLEFINQIATFSQLEQQRQTNSRLGVLELYQSSLNNSAALNIVGKEVKLQDNGITHESEGQSHTFTYSGDSSATRLTVAIIGDLGKEIYSTTQEGVADGEQSFTWNGLDAEGNPVSPGEYRVRVTMEDWEGEVYPSNVFQRKLVDGISYENGSVMLITNDRKLPIENVVEVYGVGIGAGSGDDPEGDAVGQFKNPTNNPYNPLAYQPFTVIPGGR